METHGLLSAINRVFRRNRPLKMVRNPGHCEECAEHEATMQSATPQSISLVQVGSPAWDPVCFITDEAYGYFMPGLARLAMGRGEDYYLDQFLSHLESGRIDSLDSGQCRAVATLLDHLYKTNSKEIEDNMDDKVLGHVMDLLEQRLTALQTSR